MFRQLRLLAYGGLLVAVACREKRRILSKRGYLKVCGGLTSRPNGHIMAAKNDEGERLPYRELKGESLVKSSGIG